MIPKIIHYCWLSNDPFPELITKCMESWKKVLPDYEFMLWDTNKFPLESNVWVKQAFESKKYAFAADYIRLHAVYNHGGIYLDGDIEVLKSFNPLLHLPYFIGSESDGIIEAGVFGAEKGATWIAECLKHYEGRQFIKSDSTFDTLTLPRIMMACVQKNHTIIEIKNPEIKTLDYTYSDKIQMFPKDFFCAKNHGTGIIEKTPNTFCIHHFAMSWLPKNRTVLPNIKRSLIKVFGVKFINRIINIMGLKKIKKLINNKLRN